MPLSASTASIPRKALLKRFLSIFLSSALLATLAALALIQAYEEGRVAIIEAREKGYLDIAAASISKEFFEIAHDLRALADVPVLQHYRDHAKPEHKQALSAYLQGLSKSYERYAQIRLIDLNGKEVIRIEHKDGTVFAVPDEQLQDKSGRYYVQEALKLSPGEVYVSPLDLNVESGQIEIPYRPMIRFAGALFDSVGKRRGAIVFNYEGNILLETFQTMMGGGRLHQGMLLDREGYWLSGDKQDEWGFMRGREDLTFSRKYPTAWPAIASSDAGRAETGQGLFLFSTVYPLQRLPMPAGMGEPSGFSRAAGARRNDYYWKIVLFIPRESLMATSLFHHPLGQAVVASIYLLLTLTSLSIAFATLRRKQYRLLERCAAAEIEDLYNHAPCGYHSLDARGLIIRINQTELDWLGYRRDEVQGRMHYHDFLAPHSREHFETCYPGLMKLGYVNDIEVEMVRRDGSRLPVLLNATTIKDAAGNFVMTRSTAFDLTERKKLEEALRRRADFDFLTGLNNRRHFYELADNELARSRRSGKPLALLLLDVDYFKHFNDVYGHAVGDAVLIALSKTCCNSLRKIDIAGRLGGEEFAFLLPETAASQARAAAERLRQAISTVSLPIEGGEPIAFTVSIGVTHLAAQDTGIDAMLKRADIALYAAKHGGRNQVRYEGP